ncbi:hypothetical protein [Plantactinospora sp. KLBMP9567]|uniref:hypothetical protein n=1 Tax=Plantactinospora sp. KLBMP9567 TaxID=3085900 RepID=UPI002980AA40|nr:hypothetical protein [Plantactinospora sp. KLBMP9567]MDW5325634.1 hypothetical protein [Plantactinospora sp. KLBMP9567]
MVIIAEPLHARPRPTEELAWLGEGWPEFVFHDEGAARHLGRIRELFAGLAGKLLRALGDLAAAQHRVICPVRPTRKARYPLTPIDRYADWTRPDGTPFDPWLRTHVRLGGRIIATAPRSQAITGTAAEWQRWTGLEFPDSGEYVIPDGLSTLHVDLDADRGSYVEPNIWVQHR